MKIKKKILSVLLTAAMVCTLLPCTSLPALAATNYEDINAGNVIISSAGDYAIIGTGTTTGNNIQVNGSITVNITLTNVKIDAYGCPFTIGANSTVNLTLIGDNTLNNELNSDYECGICVPSTATLTVTADSTGSLTVATCGHNSAGIGGSGAIGHPSNGGTVTINGGTVIATGGTYGAGIGGAGTGDGDGGDGGTVTIGGGTVIANGGTCAAGIGGSYCGSGGTVTVNGGTVTATGGAKNNDASVGGGAGIGGGGYGGSGGTVTVTGGTVTATGIDGGKDIGVGSGGSDDGDLYISGGSVNASTVPANVYQSSATGAPNVYKTTVNGLAKISAGSAVTCSINGGNKFPCATGTKNNLYLWMPSSESGEALIENSGRYYKASGHISVSNDNTITASEYLNVNTGSLPDGTIGATYSQTLSASGGSGSYTWGYTGTLPDGLALSGGAFSGKPTETGVFPITITATDLDTPTITGSQTLSITVNQTFSIDLTALSVDGGKLDPAFDSDKVAYIVTKDSGSFGNSITVTATMSDASSTLTIGGQTTTSGVASTVALSNGANLIPIVVTSPDGLSQKAYNLSVTGTGGNTGSGSVPYITIANGAAFSVTLHNTGGSYAGSVSTAYGTITGTPSGNDTVLTGTLTAVPTAWTEVSLNGGKVMIRSVTAPSTTVQNPSFY